MTIKYVNSMLEEIDLNSAPYKLLASDILDYEWDVVESGEKITGFKKGIAKKAVNIDVLRRRDVSSRILSSELIDFFETDIHRKSPGKLYFGEYYLPCYIYSAEKTNWTTDVVLSCECGVVTDHPFWVKEHPYYFKMAESESAGVKRYAYRYAYRYANGLMNTAIVNEHYADCNFRMIIYGPITDPLVYIGGHEYLVNIILEGGEYLEIDSAAETVTKVTMFGERINAFNNRNFEQSVFEPVHPGRQNVGWSGLFDFDLILYEERSEPKWQ